MPTVTLANGGFTFAESPGVAAPDARIIWHADVDPGTLHVLAVPADRHDPDAIDPASVAPWLAIAIDPEGREHAVLSDGWHHIRLDLDGGTITSGSVVLHYHLFGVARAARAALSLRQLLHLVRYGRFPPSLFPDDNRIARGIDLLRVRDALDDHASQREIARALFGDERVGVDRARGSDSLRSRVRRLIREARELARGGYRSLLGGGQPSENGDSYSTSTRRR